MRLLGNNHSHYNGVLEILQNIEKILQCKVHNNPPNHMQQACLARMFHELLSRDRGEVCSTGQPYSGIGPEAYLYCTSQGPTPEDARKDGHIRGRSRPFMKYPG